MDTLIEDLHHNNVIFSYYGFIDSSVLSEVLQITRSKLEGNNESPLVIMRIHNAINECVDNIIKHNFYPDDDRVRYKSLLVVSKQQRQYFIDTINVVTASQKETIDEQLNYVYSMSREELMGLRGKNASGHGSTLVAGATGLIELLLKADNCDCTFKNIDPHYLFNINFKVNSLN